MAQLSPERQALGLWWQHLFASYPSKAELGRTIGNLAVSEYGWTRTDSAGRGLPLPQPNQVGAWISRGALPSDLPLRLAVITLLRQSGPPPGIDSQG